MEFIYQYTRQYIKRKRKKIKYHAEDLGLYSQGRGKCLQILSRKMICQNFILESFSWKQFRDWILGERDVKLRE
jgi:hypothetical protein